MHALMFMSDTACFVTYCIHCYYCLVNDSIHKINVVVIYKQIILYINYICPQNWNANPAADGERHGERKRGC